MASFSGTQRALVYLASGLVGLTGPAQFLEHVWPAARAGVGLEASTLVLVALGVLWRPDRAAPFVAGLGASLATVVAMNRDPMRLVDLVAPVVAAVMLFAIPQIRTACRERPRLGLSLLVAGIASPFVAVFGAAWLGGVAFSPTYFAAFAIFLGGVWATARDRTYGLFLLSASGLLLGAVDPPAIWWNGGCIVIEHPATNVGPLRFGIAALCAVPLLLWLPPIARFLRETPPRST